MKQGVHYGKGETSRIGKRTGKAEPGRRCGASGFGAEHLQAAFDVETIGISGRNEHFVDPHPQEVADIARYIRVDFDPRIGATTSTAVRDAPRTTMIPNAQVG